MVAPAAVIALAGAAGLALERTGRRVPFAGLALEAGALSTTFALRALLDRARDVQSLLEAGDLEGARAAVGRHLVSRDTSALDEHGVAAATIESVAENLSDGVVAPLLAYALAGLPGAFAYRAANTLDSLWGYRTPEYRELGRHAARFDDALNLVPSRITAAALVKAALFRLGWREARRAFNVWVDEGDFTPSPNAGQPMGAMAGALGVELEKSGEYRLGSGLPRPEAADIERARGLALLAALLWVGSLLVLLSVRALREEQS
jgi:adenosylcobinamide-phosphate synthase